MKQPTLENFRDYAFYLLEIHRIGEEFLSKDEVAFVADVRKCQIEVIDYLYESKSIRKMKQLISELEIPIKLYDPNIYYLIKDDVFERFNIQIETQKEEKNVNEIVKRGIVKSETEYRLIRRFIEIYETDKSKEGLVSRLISMLDEFDLEGAKKRKTK